MATKKQIAASRRNAKKSTGPKTPAGKAVSRFNALRHGLRARLALSEEDLHELTQIREQYLRDWQPQTPDQRRLVARAAFAEWKLLQWLATRRRFVPEAEDSSSRLEDRLAAGFSLRLARLQQDLRNAYDKLMESMILETPVPLA
jgi:hypothetical protein